MGNFTQELQNIVTLLQMNFPLVLSIIGILFAVHLINFILGYRLCYLGIIPRHPLGLAGILFSPFLHGDFNHLFFNAIPLFVLMNMVLFYGVHTFYCVSVIVIIFSGVLVWLFGRPAIHVGASSVIMGYWGFLLINAFQQPSAMTILLAAVSIYYFGGLIMALLPQAAFVSWEAHVFGFIAGLSAIYLCQLPLF